jgi:hypothetical protein
VNDTLIQCAPVGRYELAAHVKRHNPALYSDLVQTGLLQKRGGDLTADDEWLSANPAYLNQACCLPNEVAFLLPAHDGGNEESTEEPNASSRGRRNVAASALWFRLPQVNGKHPPKDAPWVCFRKQEQFALEHKYRQVARERSVVAKTSSTLQIVPTSTTASTHEVTATTTENHRTTSTPTTVRGPKTILRSSTVMIVTRASCCCRRRRNGQTPSLTMTACR